MAAASEPDLEGAGLRPLDGRQLTWMEEDMARAIADDHAYRLHWSAAVWSGLIAGIAFLALEMAILIMMGQSPWGPPRMMGAIILGQDALPPPATFDPGVFAGAMAVHLPLSIIYAVIFGIAAERLALLPALAAGAVFGLLLYLINFYGFTAFFPWFEMARGAGSIVGHVFYGLVLALAYKLLSR